MPSMGTGELNDMCRVFGKDNLEGEKLFRVRHCSARLGGLAVWRLSSMMYAE